MNKTKKDPIFKTYEEYVNHRLENMKFKQAIPIFERYGRTVAIGIFYENQFEETQYMELRYSDLEPIESHQARTETK